ncbi:class I SAM-dependent methyltransferase [Nocardioides sp. CPCC 205120]|uniref:class I SAM-dependent methyltransferase n=1 Tax=Nocardioides sp. CPCC 205120 TaxID=3406462 RepID=UPI003B5017B6
MSNEQVRRTWVDNAAGWVANESTYDAIFAPVTAALLEAGAPTAGERVLDVGCGSGTLLAAAAERGAEVVGVDISAPMADAARERVPGATVLALDAQDADLAAAAPGRPFDLLLSRFGVMFFADPVGAFTNLRSACAPGARLAVACWRTAAENPIFTLGTSALVDAIETHHGPREARDPHGPGPVALAEPDRVRALLGAAGWSDVDLRPLDYTHDHGYDGSDGVESRLAAILGTTTGREAHDVLVPLLGEDGWAALLDDVRAELRAHLVDGAVRYPGAVWIVTAAA